MKVGVAGTEAANVVDIDEIENLAVLDPVLVVLVGGFHKNCSESAILSAAIGSISSKVKI